MAVKRPTYAKDMFFGNSDLDVFSSQMVVIGTLLRGQPSGLVGYFNPPRYRAFRFAAAQERTPGHMGTMRGWGCVSMGARHQLPHARLERRCLRGHHRLAYYSDHPVDPAGLLSRIPRIRFSIFTLPRRTELARPRISRGPVPRSAPAGSGCVIVERSKRKCTHGTGSPQVP